MPSVDREAKRELVLSIVRVGLSLALLVAIATVLGIAFRPELTRFGRWFIEHFGLTGMVVGSLLADGVHFPLPPQFYLLTGVASGYSAVLVFVAVLVGSELGGLLAFELARFAAARSGFVRARIEGPRRQLARLTARGGRWGLAAATLLPIGFSTLCMAGGAMGLPRRAYAVFAATRILRLAVSYAVILAAWRAR
jgi:membrane protein YqaA with SNARE-associated domain